jgi:chitinase
LGLSLAVTVLAACGDNSSQTNSGNNTATGGNGGSSSVAQGGSSTSPSTGGHPTAGGSAGSAATMGSAGTGQGGNTSGSSGTGGTGGTGTAGQTSSAGGMAGVAGESGAGGTSGTGGSSGTGGTTGTSGTSGAGGSTSTGPKRVVAYFIAWGVYQRNFHVMDIPADKVTHINYAFANISADGRCVLGDSYADIDKAYPGDTWDAGVLRGSFNQLNKLKAAHPNVKTLISVGGWTWSSKFSDAALTPESRQKFAQSCVEFMSQYGFDGIDVDWEYPGGGGLETNVYRPEDKQNYTLLLAELRKQLEAKGQPENKHYLLTIAAPVGPAIYANIELNKITNYLDWVNLMAYDFHGSWESMTNFNAPMHAMADDPTSDPVIKEKFNVDSAVQGYLQNGVASDKLVLGLPFYGRGYKGVPGQNNGLFQAHTGASQGTWESGFLDYEDIKNNYLGSYTRYWNQEAQVPWLYNPAQGIMISYDDPESIGIKADYINQHNLGGAMFWELSSDDAQASLLSTVYNRFH